MQKKKNFLSMYKNKTTVDILLGTVPDSLTFH